MIRAVGGTGQYAEQRTMDRTGMGSYQDVDRVEFRDRDNIQLSELKALKSGEGIIVFEDQQIRSNSIYIPDERGILLFETAIDALKETGGRYRWLKEQENIRISKKRIEEAHQNNTSVQGVPESSQPQRAPSPPTAHYDTQDAYYENLADQSFADDFDNTTEHLTY